MSDLDEQSARWFEDYAPNLEDIDIDEYDISSIPNDFNVLTLFNFVESGAVRIPGFQRNFVWDIKRSSKLIESLILGLPVPQIFLYEESRNNFLVIDGQQRMMSIYYFIKQRFPKKEKRAELRQIFDRNGNLPDDVLYSDEYFSPFKLNLGAPTQDKKNRFSGLNYATLNDYKLQFDLRPIRNVIVKQNDPDGDDSSMYEIFNRLNTGGVNLRPQEIRSSMFHSAFYDMLARLNMDDRWRRLLQMPSPDLHMKDLEILIRAFAMMVDADNYVPSMIKFLNQFSKKSKKNSEEQNRYLEELFHSFLEATRELPSDAFINKSTRRFNIALFEAIFTALGQEAFRAKSTITRKLSVDALVALERDPEFVGASKEGTTAKVNVEQRLDRAKAVLGS